MTPFDLLILALATWYLAHALTKTRGPFNLFATLRGRFHLGGLTSCPVCAAPWMAGALFLLGDTPLQPLVVVLAIAGGALMLGSYSGASHS